jgi:hypothetical protein
MQRLTRGNEAVVLAEKIKHMSPRLPYQPKSHTITVEEEEEEEEFIRIQWIL